MFKKLRLTFLLIVSFIAIFVLSSCSIWDKTHLDPAGFDDYTDQFFASVIGKDELTCNYYFAHREDYGFEHFEPNLSTPGLSSPLNVLVTNLVLGRVDGYDYNELTSTQQMTYNVIKHTLNYINSVSTEMGYLSNNYLGSYLGYQAQLPILLVEYHFRDQIDVENYLKYLALVPDTFKSYYDFEVKKTEAGYGMPDFVIDKVLSQCETFVNSIDDDSNFMFSVVNDKIDDCTFLSPSDKEHYKEQNVALIKNDLREGYEYIKDNLGNLKGRATNNGGLAGFVKEDGTMIGRDFYEAKFKYIVGYDMNCSSAIEYIDSKIATYINEAHRLKAIINENPNYQEQLDKINNDELVLCNLNPLDTLLAFEEAIQADFPALGYTPEIEVKYVDDSMKNNFSPAAYMTSPIDEIGKESIYLNPAEIYLLDGDGNPTETLDYNYLYNTLAHEGLPGHLYQTAYFKAQDVHPLRKLLRNSGFTEGWATYAQNYVFKYLKNDNVFGNQFYDVVIDYLETMEKVKAACYSRLDLGIHYDGWSIEEAYNFMSRYFTLSSIESFTKAYQQLVEIPTNYQQYFFTYLKLCDLYDNVSMTLGEDFNPVEYHKTILDCGCAPLMYIEDVVYNKYNINE